MKVYILLQCQYDEVDILGVYATDTSAETARRLYYPPDNNFVGYVIEAWEVNS